MADCTPDDIISDSKRSNIEALTEALSDTEKLVTNSLVSLEAEIEDSLRGEIVSEDLREKIRSVITGVTGKPPKYIESSGLGVFKQANNKWTWNLDVKIPGTGSSIDCSSESMIELAAIAIRWDNEQKAKESSLSVADTPTNTGKISWVGERLITGLDLGEPNKIKEYLAPEKWNGSGETLALTETQKRAVLQAAVWHIFRGHNDLPNKKTYATLIKGTKTFASSELEVPQPWDGDSKASEAVRYLAVLLGKGSANELEAEDFLTALNSPTLSAGTKATDEEVWSVGLALDVYNKAEVLTADTTKKVGKLLDSAGDLGSSVKTLLSAHYKPYSECKAIQTILHITLNQSEERYSQTNATAYTYTGGIDGDPGHGTLQGLVDLFKNPDYQEEQELVLALAGLEIKENKESSVVTNDSGNIEYTAVGDPVTVDGKNVQALKTSDNPPSWKYEINGEQIPLVKVMNSSNNNFIEDSQTLYLVNGNLYLMQNEKIETTPKTKEYQIGDQTITTYKADDGSYYFLSGKIDNTNLTAGLTGLTDNIKQVHFTALAIDGSTTNINDKHYVFEEGDNGLNFTEKPRTSIPSNQEVDINGNEEKITISTTADGVKEYKLGERILTDETNNVNDDGNLPGSVIVLKDIGNTGTTNYYYRIGSSDFFPINNEGTEIHGSSGSPIGSISILDSKNLEEVDHDIIRYNVISPPTNSVTNSRQQSSERNLESNTPTITIENINVEIEEASQSAEQNLKTLKTKVISKLGGINLKKIHSPNDLKASLRLALLSKENQALLTAASTSGFSEHTLSEISDAIANTVWRSEGFQTELGRVSGSSENITKFKHEYAFKFTVDSDGKIQVKIIQGAEFISDIQAPEYSPDSSSIIPTDGIGVKIVKSSAVAQSESRELRRTLADWDQLWGNSQIALKIPNTVSQDASNRDVIEKSEQVNTLEFLGSGSMGKIHNLILALRQAEGDEPEPKAYDAFIAAYKTYQKNRQLMESNVSGDVNWLTWLVRKGFDRDQNKWKNPENSSKSLEGFLEYHDDIKLKKSGGSEAETITLEDAVDNLYQSVQDVLKQAQNYISAIEESLPSDGSNNIQTQAITLKTYLGVVQEKFSEDEPW